MKTENGAQCLTKRNYVLLYCDMVVKLLIPKIWYNWLGSFSSQPKLAVWLFHLPLHFQAKIILGPILQAPQRVYCQLEQLTNYLRVHLHASVFALINT